MGIKFAKDIVKDIEERGVVSVPEGYVIGENFERWLYEPNDNNDVFEYSMEVEFVSKYSYNEFDKSSGIGDAA